MTLFDHPEEVGQVFEESAESAEGGHKPEPAAVKRPSRWSVRNWPVRWKVLAIALLPLTLAGLFGGLRISNALTEANRLRLVADRAEMIPAITNYMSALGDALVAASSDGDAEGARKNFENRKYELQSRLSHTDVATDVRSGVESLIERGQGLLSSVSTTGVGLRDEVTGYAPILLTAEDAINGSVRVDSERIRAQTEGLSRAVGARGQMMMQELLVNRGGELPDPELRSSMMTLAGTEPSTLFGMSEVLGVDSPDAKSLQQQLVTRMSIMSDPEQVLPNNPVLRDSIRTTDQIAAQLISENTGAVTAAVEDRAADRRAAALRDIVLVLAAITATLLAVWLVARSLVRPLRTLRDSALQVAHVDLEQEIARLRAGVPGSDRDPDPLPVYTTEEVGQVAHAVDELHAQALLLAGDEARLRRLVNEMFETMSRRNRSLVDQQLALIDRLERNEDDPDRLESLFRLDHLAARMRRNGANLLVLAGARVPHERGRPVPLATLISAAASEVEGYDRVQTVLVPDTTVIGAAAADCIHLLAELIDNALRYSAPTEPVRVVAGFENDGGVVVEVVDVGLGMTDADLRMANMRLAAGGEFSPENARHMGLFVISRLAARHEIEVRLFPASQGSRGITAEVYLPPHLLTVRPFEEPSPALATPAQPYFAPAEQPQPAPQRHEPEPYEYEPEPYQSYAPYQDAEPAEPGPVVSLLPRRTPGSSGITGVPSEQPEQSAQPPTAPERVRRELPQPWWEAEEQGAGQPDAPASHGAPEPVAEKFAPADTSGYFAARARLGAAAPEPEPQREPEPETETETETGTETETDSIYQRMLSESVGIDPNEPSLRADLDWQSVWDRGWSVAAEAENVPVVAHTEHGLPVREPGARLVPGSAAAAAPAEEDPHAAAHDPADAEQPVTSNGVPPQPAHEPLERDPAAIRTSISSHFGGVHAARSHARENGLQGGLDKGLEKGPENGLDTDQGQNQ